MKHQLSRVSAWQGAVHAISNGTTIARRRCGGFVATIAKSKSSDPRGEMSEDGAALAARIVLADATRFASRERGRHRGHERGCVLREYGARTRHAECERTR